MIEGLPVERKALERTVRLVSSARLRPPVLADLVPDDMLEALAEIEGATSGRLNDQWRGTVGIDQNEFVYDVPHAHFINASFCYSKPRNPNRFNGPDRGAWYAALHVDTCIAEVKFHITQELANIGEFDTRIEYAEMFASFAGEMLNLTVLERSHDCLHPDPTVGYAAGNAIADSARASGINLILYPSVRHPGGTCLAALSPHTVQSVAQGDMWEMRWQGHPEPTIAKIAA